MTRTNRTWLWLLGCACTAACSSKNGTAALPMSTAGQVANVAGSVAVPPVVVAGGGSPAAAGSVAVIVPMAGSIAPSGSAGAAGARVSGGAGGVAGLAPIAGSEADDDAGLPTGDAAVGGQGGSQAPVLPPTGTFPAVKDIAAKGPYTAKTVNNTGPGNAYTLFHPTELAPGGVLNPIVSWGNGGATTPALYPMLPQLASHGFVVIAANDIAVTGDEVRAGIDWISQQNEVMSSPFYHKLDTKNVSGVGYSLGGLATYAACDDPRFVTIVIISGANMGDKSPVAKLHTPTAYFCTDDDASQGNCDGDFAIVKVPSFYGVMKGTEHVDVVFDTATSNRLTKVTTAWLRWQQMADQTQKPTFVGTDCSLCKDAEWVTQQKNGLM